MVKFQAWHEEHETKVKQRGEDHRKVQKAKNTYVAPVKEVKVEEATEQPESTETTTENSEG